jgi:DNA-directed RNA polymerase specialized sigma24 family protein
MIDFDAPSSKLAVAELQKDDVRGKIYRFALWQAGSEADAQDLVADAMLLVCDPERKPWNPAKGSFFSHMRFAIRDLRIARGRAGRGRLEKVGAATRATFAFDEQTVDERPLPDEALHERHDLARLRRLGQQLVARVGEKHPIARQVFECASLGIETPAEMAHHIGCPVDRIYDALELLKYHGAQVKADDEEATQRAMQDVRDQHRADARSEPESSR